MHEISMIIKIATIPNDEQRYPTWGDYYTYEGVDHIKVSKFENEDIEFIVAVHELIEMWLTKKRGIQEPDITKFDIESGLDDPGESKDAPYHKEHMFAVEVEKILCKELGISYEDYYNAQPYGSTDTNK